jgi:hypothetical protein
MSDPNRSGIEAYFMAMERTKTAWERYNYASTALELARVKERLAELKSQHEPLAGLIEKTMGERERLYASAFYAVVGRMPEPEEAKP